MKQTKILIIADTHYRFNKQDYDKLCINFDICVSLGDVDLFTLNYFSNLCKLQQKPMLAIVGNHDYWELFNSIAYIQDLHLNHYIYNTITYAGFGGSYRYKESRAPLFTDEESYNLLKQFQPCDVFFSHDSAKLKKLKTIDLNQFNDKFTHPGLIGIYKYIKKVKPKYHIHGHHHINIEYQLKHTYCYGVYGIALFNTSSGEMIHLL